MPVDDAELESLKLKTEEKLNQVRLQRAELDEMLQTITEITQIDEPDATAEEPNRTKKVLPTDRFTGVKILSARRQTIYDRLMTDKATLGI